MFKDKDEREDVDRDDREKEGGVRDHQSTSGLCPSLRKQESAAVPQDEPNQLKTLKNEGQDVEIEVTQSNRVAVFGPETLGVKKAKNRLKLLPGYACSSCAIGPECPEFREGYVYAYRDAFRAYSTRSADEVLGLMSELVQTNQERLRFGLLMEGVTSGGMPDPNITRLTEVVMQQANALVDLDREVRKVTLRIDDTSDNPGPVKRGILSTLFGTPAAAPLQAAPIAGELNARPVIETQLAQDDRANDPRDVNFNSQNEGGEMNVGDSRGGTSNPTPTTPPPSTAPFWWVEGLHDPRCSSE